MQGNQFFLARNYNRAAKNFENVLAKDPTNKAVKKKIIICYTQTGEVNKAFQIFSDLVTEDASYIIDTDIKEDYCPCPDLIEHFVLAFTNDNNSVEFKLILAMLWLYCNAAMSLKYFKELQSEMIETAIFSSIVKSIEDSLKFNQT